MRQKGKFVGPCYSSRTILKMEAVSYSEKVVPVHDIHCFISKKI